jgi:UDPglucose 6-dehydrogenase
MRVTVIGTGHLGAVHAAGMAEIGHDVLGVDADAETIAKLASARSPFFEPGLREMLTRNIKAGRLRFSTSLREAASFGDVHFICVGTPQAKGSHQADLTSLEAVANGLAPHLTRGCLVVGKSTVPVGTAARIRTMVTDQAPAGDEIQIAWNPEFLREGLGLQDTLHPDRIVVGVSTPEAAEILHDVYAPIIALGTPYIRTDLATAELVKVSANAFLAMRISFVNAVAEMCDVANGDIVTLTEALALDPRIGAQFLSAGLGYGGGCLPKDVRAFRATAAKLGVADLSTFLKDIDDINARQRQRTVELARGMLDGTFARKRIGILGAAFKPNTDDVRDSPALEVAALIQQQGALVLVHDPEAIENARARVPSLDYRAEIADVFEQADLIMHLTAWPEYRELDPAALAALTRTPRILDARDSLDLISWQKAGWTIRALGRGEHY